ncbi:alkaline phosphatase family protein [Natrinema halophilum]|nr:alkaline phosphatase family protein [Natrinema halophilum]
MLDRFDVSFPYLDSVREQGVSGDLMSVDTPTTIPAWTSFATGKDPGSHGVHNMNQVSSEYEYGPVKPNTSDAAVYDFLDDALFLNLPASTGRIPCADGTLVESSLLEKTKAEMVPEPLRDLDTYEAYNPMHDHSKKQRPNVYRDHLRDIIASRERFAREAFETHDPRFGFVLFSATDWAGHMLSKLTSEAKREEFYRTIVEDIGKAVEELAELGENVVLMSDHGFEYKHHTIHLADWLHEQGYLSVTSNDDSKSHGVVDRLADRTVEFGVSTAQSLSRRSDRLYDFFRLVHNRLLGSGLGDRIHEASTPDVDYPESTAWQLRYGCLYLNDDRFESPKVSADEREQLQRELVSGLRELTVDGERIFRDVLTPEEAYADPSTEMPDVISRPASGYHAITHWSPTGGYTSPTENFEHRYRGLIAATGPLFGTGEIEGMSIVDLLPSLLAAMGEPLSPEFDGTVQSELLADEPAVEYLDSDAIPTPQVRGESRAEQAEREAVVEERLADLGYME